MKGGIYTDERCPICGSGFKDDHRTGLSCPNHPNIKATSFNVRFGQIHKRFKSYKTASVFLTGLRFKTDEQTFDARDYRKDNPLSFKSMSRKYLDLKRGKAKMGTFKNTRRHLELANESLGRVSVKDIKYGHLEDFIEGLEGLSDKTRHNILSTVHAFFVWLCKRKDIPEMPEFPVIEYTLKMGKTISKQTQQDILAEIKRIAPFKVWLGIKWLTTYISVRPKEMINLKEGDIDLENGYFVFPHPKEKDPKEVPVLLDDLDLARSCPSSMPAMPFFRHGAGISGVAENEPYGEKYFYKWWVIACGNLGIEGVDLYRGTRHSSARALRRHRRTPEEIKKAMMTKTNKAFERYFIMEDDDLRNIYEDSAQVIDITKLLPAKKDNSENN